MKLIKTLKTSSTIIEFLVQLSVKNKKSNASPLLVDLKLFFSPLNCSKITSKDVQSQNEDPSLLLQHWYLSLVSRKCPPKIKAYKIHWIKSSFKLLYVIYMCHQSPTAPNLHNHTNDIETLVYRIHKLNSHNVNKGKYLKWPKSFHKLLISMNLLNDHTQQSDIHTECKSALRHTNTIVQHNASIKPQMSHERFLTACLEQDKRMEVTTKQQMREN